MSKHIGIVGVSAEGAALCYRTICAEGPALMGPHAHPEVTLHTLPLSRWMAPIYEYDWDAVGELMLQSAQLLAEAGADLLICPDNTAHQGLERIRSRSPLPWLHIAEEVAAEAQRRGHSKVGVTGTQWLMEGPVYAKALDTAGIARRIPDAEARSEINRIIMDELVYGRFEAEARSYFQQVIGDLAGQGCEAVVLGCTEIPLLIREGDSELPTLDSTRLLARGALREALRS